jgi:hypothetical protein
MNGSSRILLAGLGGHIGAAIVASMISENKAAIVERTKQVELAYHESGKRSRNGDFKKRIAAMQMRKAAEASAKNAQRDMRKAGA